MAIRFIKLSPQLEAVMMGPFVQLHILFPSPNQVSCLKYLQSQVFLNLAGARVGGNMLLCVIMTVFYLPWAI